jgi:4-amino-4-deoxy-L-arabinose transferase-like glycosyltransferase
LRRLGGGRLADLAVPLGFGLALLLLVPWRTAYRLGMDEGFELMKALLVSQGHRLYGAFWNDQPPLHTELLALLFRVFGPSAGVGRLLSVGFAALLVAALYSLARRGSNRLAGVLAVALLASASEVLKLSVSAMLELPAFALALAAVWAWYQWTDDRSRGWLAASGALMGCALQVKFTAGLLLPAWAVAWWIKLGSDRLDRSPEPDRRRLGWWEVLLWLGCAAGAFGLVVVLWYGPGAWEMMTASHFSAATRASAAAGGLSFSLDAMREDAGLVFLALPGLFLQLFLRRRELWFPVAWLGTAFLVHWQHRPYWSYYHLHFAIPLAWLGGAGLIEGFRWIWRRLPPVGGRGWWLPGAAWVAWSVVFAAGLSLALEKAAWELGRLRAARPAIEEPSVQRLQAHGVAARWVFTDDLLAAFWAGLPIPPELAVIPWKRLWSGQLTPEQVRAALERHRPELILLSDSRRREYGLEDYLTEHYQPVAEAPDLYRRK